MFRKRQPMDIWQYPGKMNWHMRTPTKTDQFSPIQDPRISCEILPVSVAVLNSPFGIWFSRLTFLHAQTQINPLPSQWEICSFVMSSELKDMSCQFFVKGLPFSNGWSHVWFSFEMRRSGIKMRAVQTIPYFVHFSQHSLPHTWVTSSEYKLLCCWLLHPWRLSAWARVEIALAQVARSGCDYEALHAMANWIGFTSKWLVVMDLDPSFENHCNQPGMRLETWVFPIQSFWHIRG